MEKGCAARKLVLGLPTYGRIFKATTNSVDRLAPSSIAGTKGKYTREDGFRAYYELCKWNQVDTLIY